MKAELIQRLFRAIGERDQESLDSLCRAVVEDERKKGHSDLATRLEKILLETDLYSNKQPSPIKRSEDSFGTGVMTSLPSNLKNDLFSMINREELRHHMVLPQEVEKRLLRIELEYTRKEVLATYGLRPRKRILLYGPPGNGKTLSAERLAWNTGLPLVKVRFDSLISSYLGETSSNLRRIFESFKNKPVVLFLDECDSIARSRNDNNDVSEIPRVVNTLLQFLDEYNLPGLLLAATNLEKALDTAFFRRFDDIFEIPKPGTEEILGLLKMTLATFDVSSKIDWGLLSIRLKGRSAAFVVKAAQDAAKNAIFHDRRLVDQSDLELAINELHDGEF